MTDSPKGGPLPAAAPKSAESPSVTQQRFKDVPRALSAYGEGVPLPPMKTQADRDAFDGEQRRGWFDR